MPRFTRKRRRTIKRTFRRKFKKIRKHGIPTLHNKGLIVSDRAIVHLRYSDTRVWPTGAIFGTNVYRINSMFDPGGSLSTRQPTGFDTWESFYNRYRVFAVSYKVMVVSSQGTDIGMLAVVTPSNSLYVPVSLAEAQQQRHSRSRNIQRGSNVVTIRGKVNLPRLTGRTPSAYHGSDQTMAVTTQDPSEICGLTITVGSMDAVTNILAEVTTEIIFHAEMFDPNVLAVSS